METALTLMVKVQMKIYHGHAQIILSLENINIKSHHYHGGNVLVHLVLPHLLVHGVHTMMDILAVQTIQTKIGGRIITEVQKDIMCQVMHA